MMKFSHSRVNTFVQCPYQFKLRYVDGLKTIPNQDADNALYLGTALHTGIEKDIQTAVEDYHRNYYVSDEKNFIEAYKLEQMLKKTILPDGLHEVKIDHPDFVGFIDLLVPVCEGEYDMYDFKYSNNVEKYMESEQLHLYKYFYELTTGNRIRNMFFLFVPKTAIRQKKTENLTQFYKRLQVKLDEMQPELRYVEYNPKKVADFLLKTLEINRTTEYTKNITKLCDWCEFKDYCQKGENYMLLPSTELVPVSMEQYKKIWIYGEPFSGKTHLASEAPAPVLELNTDGNVKHYTMPRLSIKDSVVLSGRTETKKYGWETFCDAVTELENGSDFKTIVVDLLDDVYDSCRAKICSDNGWEHESDDSFKAYDIVRNEFLRTMKRFMNLPYNIILISHEDSSKDIMKRGGDKVTQVKPNIPEKVAKKLAGMVDIVLRTEKNHDEYVISTKTNSVIFGGGRLDNIKSVELPNNWDSVESLYFSEKNVSKTDTACDKMKEPSEPVEEKPAVVYTPEETSAMTEEPKTRTRRKRN